MYIIYIIFTFIRHKDTRILLHYYKRGLLTSQPEIICVSFRSQTVPTVIFQILSHVSRVCLLIIQRRGAKPRLRQRTRSISQTAGVFVCPRDVMVCEPSQDDRGRSLPRVIEVVRTAVRASRRFDVVIATSTSNVPCENSSGCSRVASV